MDNMKPILIVGVVLLALVALVAGCTSASAQAKGANKARSLKLFAFNYTGRAIRNITVDDMWLGGADAYTNGGSAMGPQPPRDRTKQHTVEVKWDVSGLYDMRTDTYTRMPVESKSASVPIKFPYPDNPNELVLHFYPDGRVEAEMISRQDSVFNFRRIPIPEGHREHGRP
ncbi:MAG TPA: DUF3304 domain-containing protein [Xanthomonadaceae bacterium]|nr:DUF3304 domain-containing protein [Luteimonas sp.]HRQ66816.1 DUF3304 domain-containing protein [Xanthomonadaceae bacterium]